jgi:TonB family protein
MVDAGRGGDRGGPSARGAAIALVVVLSLAACATPPAPPSPGPPAAPPALPPRAVPPASTACPAPTVPESLRRSDATGLTRVTGEVQPDGTVRSVVVVRSSGSTRAHKLLDRAAADALSRCRFPPEAGTAPATTTVDYRWTLD